MLLLVMASCSSEIRNEKKFLKGIQSTDAQEEQDAFEEFCSWIKTDKATMGYDFNLLREKLGMKIVNSPDGKLRLYSWEIDHNDSIISYANIVQLLVNDGKLVGYSGPLNTMLTGKNPDIKKRWTLAHSIDTVFEVNVNNQPVYLIVQSYLTEELMNTSYVSAAVTQGLRIATLRFFFDGVENAGYRKYIDDGKVNKKDLIKWDDKTKTLYAYMTDDNNHVIPGKYEIYRLNGDSFTKVEPATEQ